MFAPSPDESTRVCTELADGGRQCDYTCNKQDAIFFQLSGNLTNTASSQCTDSDVGFDSIYDCVGKLYKV